MAFQGHCRWLISGVPAGRLEGWLDWIVEREGVIKCITVRHLVLASTVPKRA